MSLQWAHVLNLSSFIDSRDINSRSIVQHGVMHEVQRERRIFQNNTLTHVVKAAVTAATNTTSTILFMISAQNNKVVKQSQTTSCSNDRAGLPLARQSTARCRSVVPTTNHAAWTELYHCKHPIVDRWIYRMRKSSTRVAMGSTSLRQRRTYTLGRHCREQVGHLSCVVTCTASSGWYSAYSSRRTSK